jgi:hypothetical protein
MNQFQEVSRNRLAFSFLNNFNGRFFSLMGGEKYAGFDIHWTRQWKPLRKRVKRHVN